MRYIFQKALSLFHAIKGNWICIPVRVFLILFALEIIFILRMNDGHLIYTLDDAYIHLSLAENISRGEYGVNPGESCAPSSSIIWPLLLVPFSKFQFGNLIPLIINLFASIGTIIVCTRIILLIFDDTSSRKLNLFCIFISILLIPAFNLIGLAFTGMEYSLQIFIISLVVLGLIQIALNKKTHWWFYPAIILGPLIRYENLAISLPALIFLFKLNPKASIVSAILMFLPIIGFSLFLHSMGPGIFPSSILVKSDPVMDAGKPIAILGNFLRNILLHRQGLMLLALPGFLYMNYRFIKPGKERIFKKQSCAPLFFIFYSGNSAITTDMRYISGCQCF